ncbi:MAG: CPBP family intramembrane metalloprotease [Planctomycetes bacterium]|nr:CPBP family intramembrane metalloprotease [Planctomycetota bacterium]
MLIEATPDSAEVGLSAGHALASMVMGLGGIALARYLVVRHLRPRVQLESPPPRSLPWKPLHLPLLFLVFLMGSALVGFALKAIYGDVDMENLGVVPILASTIVVNLILVAGVWTLGVNLGAKRDAYGMSEWPSFSHMKSGVLMFLACLPGVYGSSLLWIGSLSLAGVHVEPQDVAQLVGTAEGYERWIVLVFASILVPILEEFLFRGFLQTWLVQSQGVVTGILVTSFLFAMLHGATAFGGLLAFSLAAGLIRHWTGSLWPAVWVHMCNNGIMSIALFMGTGPVGS